jgi:hypothetical protein
MSKHAMYEVIANTSLGHQRAQGIHSGRSAMSAVTTFCACEPIMDNDTIDAYMLDDAGERLGCVREFVMMNGVLQFAR